MCDDQRAVSELIGFIMIFALVLGTISIVYVAGIGSLDDTRDAERMQNAERAFDVLADNLQELGRGEAPNRATEIRLSDAQLSMEERYRIRFKVDGTTESEAAPRPIVFDGGTGTRIVYEQGAVIRNDQDGGVRMIREPDYLFHADRTVVRHVEPRGGQQSVGGTTTALVRAERNTPRLVYGQDVSGSTVELEMETTAGRAPAWVAYFESRPTVVDDCSWPDDESGDTLVTISCGFEADELYVSRTIIDVELTD